MRTHVLRFVCFLTLACGLCLLAGQPAAQARTEAQKKAKKVQQAILDVFGEPTGFKSGLSFRYALWASNKGWHLRSTTANKMHEFKGSIVVEGGTITGIENFHLEKKGHDFWNLNDNRREINFDFKTDGGIDGIDFQVSAEATLILWDLFIDGQHRPEHTYVGKNGVHPNADLFSVPAHPKKK